MKKYLTLLLLTFLPAFAFAVDGEALNPWTMERQVDQMTDGVSIVSYTESRTAGVSVVCYPGDDTTGMIFKFPEGFYEDSKSIMYRVDKNDPKTISGLLVMDRNMLFLIGNHSYFDQIVAQMKRGKNILVRAGEGMDSVTIKASLSNSSDAIDQTLEECN